MRHAVTTLARHMPIETSGRHGVGTLHIYATCTAFVQAVCMHTVSTCVMAHMSSALLLVIERPACAALVHKRSAVSSKEHADIEAQVVLGCLERVVELAGFESMLELSFDGSELSRHDAHLKKSEEILLSKINSALERYEHR